MKTVKQAANQSGISEKLCRAVVRQIGDAETLEDVTRGGADAGFPGFTYYKDSVAFFKRNRAEIVKMVVAMADDLGEDPLQMVAGFQCLAGRQMKRVPEYDMEGSRKATRENKEAMAEFMPSIARAIYGGRITKADTHTANALAWFALEEVARAFCDE